MSRVAYYTKGMKKKITFGVLLKTIGSLAELFLPLVMAYMIDTVAPKSESAWPLVFWGGIMLLCAVAAWLGNVIANRVASKVARDITEKVRTDLFSKTLYLSSRQTDEVTVPSLVSRLSSDTYNLHNMLGMVQRMGIRAPILIIGGVIMTFTVDPILALVLLAVVPILTVIVIILSKRGIVLYTALQRASDVMVRKVRDDYSGTRVIKALSKTEYEGRSFQKINDNVAACETKAGITMGITNPLVNMLLNLGMTAVILVGAYRVAAGAAKVGQIIAFTSYFTIILNAVIAISRIFVNISKGSASAKRIGEILSMPEETCKEAFLDRNDAEFISFENVSFGYNGAPALQNISFGINKGETLGVLGATGSGKSTIVSLLMRFYDADEGVVRIGGKDVRTYAKEQLREKFGVVFQNDFLMAASIRENIDFERGLKDDDIDNAIRFAKADGFINSLEEGKESLLTVQGTNFSGGQKQRMLIARALAAKPEILILDDSSSALDYKTDAQLRKALLANFKDTTVIMIAQRISSVRFADKILVLDKGCVVGFGSDRELMKTCETYKEIYRSQVEEGIAND